ncbi:MAG: hypothetical protein EA402_00100 [Planctomycetota bacterium]|nr:MAG: hypothetical protein EA402_00100 [Planctomycetota bacterium]
MPGLSLRRGAVQAPLIAWDTLGSLVPAWACPDPDIPGALLLRLHESMGSRGCATLTARAHHQAELVDLLGKVQTNLIPINDHQWQITYTPYQLLSLRLRAE